MKQYTTPEQTAKLIELGLPRPRCLHDGVLAYNIGELIEMLPQEINNDALPDRFEVYIDHNKMWTVECNNILGELFSTYRTELIDALYDMLIRLKEGGAI